MEPPSVCHISLLQASEPALNCSDKGTLLPSGTKSSSDGHRFSGHLRRNLERTEKIII